MKKIKVLTLVSGVPNSGGVSTVVYTLQEQLNATKFVHNDVALIRQYDTRINVILKRILNKPINNKIETQLNDNIHLIEIPNNFFLNKIKKYKNISFLESKIDLNEYDIIHAHYYGDYGELAIKLAKKYNKKSIITFHGSDTVSLNESDLNIINQANYITFVSNFLEEQVQKVGLINVKTKVIHNGFNSEIFNLRNKLDDRDVVAYCGSLVDIKGVDSLKDIFTKVYNIEEKINFHIYGDGYKRKELEEYFKKNGLGVKFFGNLTQEELSTELQRVKILVMPSKREGYPCIVQESKACGVYIIATNVGGTKEAIGNIGTLIERNTGFELEMANQIIKYYNEQIYTVEEIFQDNLKSWDRITEEYSNLYQNILQEV